MLNKKSEKEVINTADIIISLGGDGTILRTVSHLEKDSIDILGVNLGGLGFLADTVKEKLTNHLDSFNSGKYSLDIRSLLKCEVNKKTFHAFNDIVIDKAGFSRVIQISVKVNGHNLNNYIADGLIVSTPTGSTGYSLSAGGPIVIPDCNVIVINPICPHSLTNRPVVIPDSSIIEVQVFTEQNRFNLLRDGNKFGDLNNGTKLKIKKSDKKIRFIKKESQNFFKTLNKKLHWGEDFRNKKRWTYQK